MLGLSKFWILIFQNHQLSLTVSSGYFNFTDCYIDLIAKKNSFEMDIVYASPQVRLLDLLVTVLLFSPFHSFICIYFECRQMGSIKHLVCLVSYRWCMFIYHIFSIKWLVQTLDCLNTIDQDGPITQKVYGLIPSNHPYRPLWLARPISVCFPFQKLRSLIDF